MQIQKLNTQNSSNQDIEAGSHIFQQIKSLNFDNIEYIYLITSDLFTEDMSAWKDSQDYKNLLPFLKMILESDNFISAILLIPIFYIKTNQDYDNEDLSCALMCIFLAKFGYDTFVKNTSKICADIFNSSENVDVINLVIDEMSQNKLKFRTVNAFLEKVLSVLLASMESQSRNYSKTIDKKDTLSNVKSIYDDMSGDMFKKKEVPNMIYDMNSPENKVYQFIKESGSLVCIAEIMGRIDINRNTLKKYLKSLVDKGKIKLIGSKKGSKYIAV